MNLLKDITITRLQNRIKELEAQLAAVRLLPEKWRKNNLDEWEAQMCADQLESAIGEDES